MLVSLPQNHSVLAIQRSSKVRGDKQKWKSLKRQQLLSHAVAARTSHRPPDLTSSLVRIADEPYLGQAFLQTFARIGTGNKGRRRKNQVNNLSSELCSLK